MRSLYSPSRSRFDPRNFGRYGLFPAQRKCKSGGNCCGTPVDPCATTPCGWDYDVTISGNNYLVCYNGCVGENPFRPNYFWKELRSASVDLNGTHRLLQVVPNGCTWTTSYNYTLVRSDSFEEFEDNGCEQEDVSSTVTMILTLTWTGSKWRFSARTGGFHFFVTTDGNPCNDDLSDTYDPYVEWNSDGTVEAPDFTPTVVPPFTNDEGGTYAETSGSLAFTRIPRCCNCSFCTGCASPVSCGTDSEGSSASCCTPETIRATTSGITVDFGSCVIGSGLSNNFKLTGTTAVNRTIDLTRTNTTTSCTWEETVACDWVLTRYANALNCAAGTPVAASWNITSLRYQLVRTAATTNGWSWRVDGLDGVTVRISVVGSNPGSCGFAAITSNATADNCSSITAPTHLTRTSCVAEGGSPVPRGIFGSGGSTSFSVCP